MYRGDLEAARNRVQTLEAKLREREAALDARDAEIAELRAEVARVRKAPAPAPGQPRLVFPSLAQKTTLSDSIGFYPPVLDRENPFK